MTQAIQELVELIQLPYTWASWITAHHGVCVTDAINELLDKAQACHKLVQAIHGGHIMRTDKLVVSGGTITLKSTCYDHDESDGVHTNDKGERITFASLVESSPMRERELVKDSTNIKRRVFVSLVVDDLDNRTDPAKSARTAGYAFTDSEITTILGIMKRHNERV